MPLQSFFNPKSIAIVGVSREPNKVGHIVAKNLIAQGYKGNVYFINHKYKGNILGHPVYKSIGDVNSEIDLAVLAIPAQVAVLYLDELKNKKITNALIYAAGFKETGVEGANLENELLEKAKEYGINILGPNCLGFASTTNGINVTFLKETCMTGNIGFISQSGALGSMLNDYFNAHINLGFSTFISLGNKTVIDESDCLEYLTVDKNTDVIAMYIEDIRLGDKFKQALQLATRKKPVIIIKSGTTKAGSLAAASHTGGMVGDDQVFSAVCAQYGALRVHTLTEFTTLLKIFSYHRLPDNGNILVLSNAGGAGVLLSDSLIQNQLNLITISDKLIKEIRCVEKGKKITLHNPIDLLGDASAFDYEQVIKIMLREKNIGAIIVLLTPQANTEIQKTAEIIVKLQKKITLPIYPVFMGKKSMFGIGRLFEKNKVVGFSNFDFLPMALVQANRWKSEMNNNLTSVISRLEKAMSSTPTSIKIGAGSMDLIHAFETIKSTGIKIAPYYLIKSEKELSSIVSKIEYPVVAKVASAKILHKTEKGGVIVNIESPKLLTLAVMQLLKISDKVIVQPMLKGHEIIIGAKRDPVFGTVLIIGMGGIYTELIKDIAYGIYPFSYDEFQKMLDKTKLKKILSGFRNSAKVNDRDIYETLIKLGDLMEQNTDIKEIDLNPLIIVGSHAVVVDARIIVN